MTQSLDRLLHELHSVNADKKLEGRDVWYAKSYRAFRAAGEPKNLDDFIRLIAFAYSWLPTIPVANPTDGGFRRIERAVAKVRRLTRAASRGATDVQAIREARRELIEAVQKSLGLHSGHTIVAVSKVLHFWNRALSPLFDINVVRAWNTLSPEGRQLLPRGLGSSPRRNNFLDYWDLADRLIQRSRNLGRPLDYRSLDKLLFRRARGER